MRTICFTIFERILRNGIGHFHCPKLFNFMLTLAPGFRSNAMAFNSLLLLLTCGGKCIIIFRILENKHGTRYNCFSMVSIHVKCYSPENTFLPTHIFISPFYRVTILLTYLHNHKSQVYYCSYAFLLVSLIFMFLLSSPTPALLSAWQRVWARRHVSSRFFVGSSTTTPTTTLSRAAINRPPLTPLLIHVCFN